ncbi:glycosyltransferase family 4 protein [Candidatus Poribacteria bacterium]
MTSDTETMERINILFVSATVPYPAIDGGRIRVLNLVSRLCQIHKVTLLTFITSQVDEQGAEHLREMGLEVVGVKTLDSRHRDRISGTLRSLLHSLVHKKPLTVAKYYSAEMVKALRHLLSSRRFHIIHFEMLHTGQFVSWLRAEGEDDYVTALGEQNIDSNVWHRLTQAEPNPLRKLIFYWQYRRFKSYESLMCRRFDMCVCVSVEDQEKLASICPGIKTEVIPNGVDLDYFKPGMVDQDRVNLVFTGSMDWQPNEDAVLYFCNRILPLIRAELPEIEFYIVGSNPSERVLRLRELKGVVVTGSVEDVRPYIADASVYVVPLRIGGGTRLKILQALAMQKAVVSTSIGCEGLDLQPDDHLLVADEPQQFAAHVIRLAKDRPFRDRLGRNGGVLVQKKYSWDIIVERLDLAYRRLASNMP